MDATYANIARKAPLVDRVQMHGDIPLPSWVELSVTDLCNRKCVFCPRVDEAAYPNQPLHMGLGLAEKIAADLWEMDYQGTITLCGFGEPLLHPQIVELVRRFGDFRVEIVTNGDRLTPKLVNRLAGAGCDFIAVSMYDGPGQIAALEAIFAETGMDYALRDRWQGEDENFGLSLLTNRAGTLDIGTQAPATAGPCAYPAYQMMIDWNGDALLCPQDWHKRVRFGNVGAQSLLEIWVSAALHKRRKRLMRGRDGLSPCSACNAGGCQHGGKHMEAWRAGG